MGITISQKEISLDLQNQGFTNTIYSQEGDADSRQLVISLFDDGEEYSISPSSNVLLQGTRADEMVVNRSVDSFSGNKVTIVFRNEELCVKGIAKYKVVIEEGGKKLSSVKFKVKVHENVYNSEGVIANPSFDVLEDAIKRTNEVIEKANDKVSEIDEILKPITNSEIDDLFSTYTNS